MPVSVVLVQKAHTLADGIVRGVVAQLPWEQSFSWQTPWVQDICSMMELGGLGVPVVVLVARVVVVGVVAFLDLVAGLAVVEAWGHIQRYVYRWNNEC